MPSYRGIEQKDLIASIKEAAGLLDKHSPGPESARLLNSLRIKDLWSAKLAPMDAIFLARTDRELKSEMESSGLRTFFRYFFDVLAYHAIANTDGAGLRVFNNLQKWSAMDGEMWHTPAEVKEEKQVWLISKYARRIAEKQGETGLIDMSRNFSYLARQRDLNPQDKTAQYLRRLVNRAAKGDDDTALAAHIRKTVPQGDLHILLEAAQRGADMAPGPGKLDIEGEGMKTYGIPWDLKADLVGAMDFQLHKLEPALAPWQDSEQAQHSTLSVVRGLTSEEESSLSLGIVFRANRLAAQAMADAFPDQPVMDRAGRRIPPRPPGQSQPRSLPVPAK